MTLPKSVFRAEDQGGNEVDAFVLVDAEEGTHTETRATGDRTLGIEFPAGAETIKIMVLSPQADSAHPFRPPCLYLLRITL